MPIIGVNRIPVKDIILNTAQNFKRSSAFRGIAGFVLMGFGIFAPVLVKGKYSVYINALCIVAVIAAVVMIIPFITAVFIKISERAYSALFGNEGILAVRNLKGNRSINGSISLLAIGISCLLFVNTLSYSSLKGLLNYYDRNTYEIYMSAKNADRNFLQAVNSTDGVKEVYKVTSIGGIEVVNKGDVIGQTQGIDTEKYLQYNNLQLQGDRQKIIDMLDKGRGILVTNRLRDRFNLKLGDEMDLRAWGNQSSYKVVGFFESIENSGNYAIISNKYMKLDMGWSDDLYSTLFIKTDGDPDKAAQNLRARFARQQPFIKTMKQMRNENVHYNEQIFLIAKGFSVMTMLAGILGIFNNLIINFIQRRRYLAMYRSVGMSKAQIVKMIFIEALTTGIIGSFTGVISGVIMIFSGAGLLKSLEMEMNIHYSGIELTLCLVFGIIVAIGASIGPALKSSRLNLMESIKYE
jgi:putative ABC transport system permease protein